MRHWLTPLGLALVVTSAACTGLPLDGPPEPEPIAEPEPSADAGTLDAGPPEDPVETARALYPRFVDVQQYIVGKSCAPNLGVCHNTFNYPDLHSGGNTLSMAYARCNVELPDPSAGWDACEQIGDILYAGPAYSSEIAWIEPSGAGRWRVGLREAPLADGIFRPQIYDPDVNVVLEPFEEWAMSVELIEGEHEAEMVLGAQDGFVVSFVEGAIGSVQAGDPNRNGVFGGSDENVPKGSVIVPGDLERSYLWGRVTKTVPGTQMPLANEPLTADMYVALACWIESMPDDGGGNDTAVDYDTCSFAQDPVDYTVYPGGPPS